MNFLKANAMKINVACVWLTFGDHVTAYRYGPPGERQPPKI